MKILYGPDNIASMPAITTAAMNRIPGMEARYIAKSKHPYFTGNKFEIKAYSPFPNVQFKKSPIRKLVYTFLNYFLFRPYIFLKLCRWILWADVIHWSWDSFYPGGFDLKLMKLFRKKLFVEWVGSDIRIPEITMKESKWYEVAFKNGYEYAARESKAHSYKIQQKFADKGFTPILVPEMQLFLKPGLFPKVYTTHYRAFDKTNQPEPFYPEISDNRKILILHSPSAKIAKGSNYIIPVVEELKKKYNIEFVLLHNVARKEVLKKMMECDIFIDQIILGSYASAAIEAMSYGKPVVAYIMPSVYKKGIPLDCPIVNADVDALSSALEQLIRNPELRNIIGKQSRQYVEKMHDADKLAKEFVAIYTSDQIAHN